MLHNTSFPSVINMPAIQTATGRQTSSHPYRSNSYTNFHPKIRDQGPGRDSFKSPSSCSGKRKSTAFFNPVPTGPGGRATFWIVTPFAGNTKGHRVAPYTFPGFIISLNSPITAKRNRSNHLAIRNYKLLKSLAKKGMYACPIRDHGQSRLIIILYVNYGLFRLIKLVYANFHLICQLSFPHTF